MCILQCVCVCADTYLCLCLYMCMHTMYVYMIYTGVSCKHTYLYTHGRFLRRTHRNQVQWMLWEQELTSWEPG